MTEYRNVLQNCNSIFREERSFMSTLFKHLRIHQIFGSTTSVGKTVLTTALLRVSSTGGDAFYLKPVSTGPDSDADDAFVFFIFHVGSRSMKNRQPRPTVRSIGEGKMFVAVSRSYQSTPGCRGRLYPCEYIMFSTFEYKLIALPPT